MPELDRLTVFEIDNTVHENVRVYGRTPTDSDQPTTDYWQFIYTEPVDNGWFEQPAAAQLEARGPYTLAQVNHMYGPPPQDAIPVNTEVYSKRQELGFTPSDLKRIMLFGRELIVQTIALYRTGQNPALQTPKPLL